MTKAIAIVVFSITDLLVWKQFRIFLIFITSIIIIILSSTGLRMSRFSRSYHIANGAYKT